MSGQNVYLNSNGYYDGNVINSYANFTPEEIEVFKINVSYTKMKLVCIDGLTKWNELEYSFFDVL